VPLDFGEPEPRSVRASRPFALLAIAVIAFLGALQAITTEAGDEMAMLEELSQKVAEVSSTGGSVSTSAGVFPLQSSLTTEAVTTAPAVEPQGASQPQSDPSGQAAAPAPPSPLEAEPTQSAATLCSPDPIGAPYCLYTVQEGDTLWDIAEMLGFGGNQYFSGAELLALSNDLNDAQNWVIVPGQELRVPVGSGIVHIVGEAETISVLAELYGTTTADVIIANPSIDPNNVIAGSELLIPSPTLWPVFGPVVVEEADAPAAAAVEEGPSDETPVAEAGESPPATDEQPVEAQPTGEGDPEAPSEAESQQADDAEGGSESADQAGSTGDAGEQESQDEQESEEDQADGSGSEPLPSAGASRNANPSVPEIRDQFAAGYIAGGGPPQYLDRILTIVIPCESGYNLRAFNPAGPFYGLMQFLPQTWANTGGGDWADAWQQGHNTGVLLLRSSPASQWPSCWR
jgi:LysM repeat protein